MRRRTHKKRIVQNLLMLTNPAFLVTQGQLREKVVNAIFRETEFYGEPEGQETDMGENICWLLLILSQRDTMNRDSHYTNTAEWWYLALSGYMRSEKQKKLLARSINACAGSR